MDNLIICARCGSDACYVDEVNQDIKTYFCYGCGFQTNSLMKDGDVFYERQLEILPELYKDLAWLDNKTGLVWIPNHTNVPDLGMVFADGPNGQNWNWGAVKATLMSDKEKAKFKAKGKEYDYKMDMTTLKHFPEREYMEALSYIGVLPE